MSLKDGDEMKKMRTLIVIFGILIISFFLLKYHWETIIVSKKNGITLKLKASIWHVHDAGPLKLYYRNKKICSNVGGYSGCDPYILSPDSNLILYIHETTRTFKNDGVKVTTYIEQYEVYDIKENKIVIIKEIGANSIPANEYYHEVVPFDGKVEWISDSKVILTKDNKRSVIDIHNRTAEITEIEE
jgi:hypothetical protein